MISTGLKSLVGFSPLLLGNAIGALGNLDPQFYEVGGAVLASGIFYGLWRQALNTNKKCWEEIERVRAERDTERTKCAECPGNTERLKRKKI